VLLSLLLLQAQPALAQQEQPTQDPAPPQDPALASPEGPTPADMQMARRHFDLGVMFYTGGNFAAARIHFEDAYRLSHKPDLLFNLARTAERMGRPGDAIMYLERYLLVRPDAPDAASIRAQIEALRAKGAVPPRPQVGVAVPLQRSSASTPGAAAASNIPPVGALGLLAGGGALLILGGGLGGGAMAAARSIDDPGNDGRYFTPDLQDIERRGQSLGGAAVAFDVLGGVAIAAGLAWTIGWVVRRRSAEEGAPLRILWAPSGRSGAGAAGAVWGAR
jgi:tetratricopeptide (TPR) repeat protein